MKRWFKFAGIIHKYRVPGQLYCAPRGWRTDATQRLPLVVLTLWLLLWLLYSLWSSGSGSCITRGGNTADTSFVVAHWLLYFSGSSCSPESCLNRIGEPVTASVLGDAGGGCYMALMSPVTPPPPPCLAFLPFCVLSTPLFNLSSNGSIFSSPFYTFLF